MGKYSSVEIVYDSEKSSWSIDTWKTTDNNEIGLSVGYITFRGNIEWEDESAKSEHEVQEAISQFMDNKMFSIKEGDKVCEELTSILKKCERGHKGIFDIMTQDNVVSYGFEKIDILDNEVFVGGMVGIGRIRITQDCSDKEIEELVSCVVKDIEREVGKEYVIIY